MLMNYGICRIILNWLEHARQHASSTSSVSFRQPVDLPEAKETFPFSLGTPIAIPMRLFGSVPLQLAEQIQTAQDCLGLLGIRVRIWYKFQILVHLLLPDCPFPVLPTACHLQPQNSTFHATPCVRSLCQLSSTSANVTCWYWIQRGKVSVCPCAGFPISSGGENMIYGMFVTPPGPAQGTSTGPSAALDCALWLL